MSEDTAGDYNAETFSVADRIVHWCGGRIMGYQHKAVEAAILFSALEAVFEMEPRSKAEKEEKHMQKYLEMIDEIDESKFEEPSLKESLKTKLFGAAKALNGKQTYRKAGEIRKSLRGDYLNKLPNNMSDLPSGTGLRDAYNKFTKDKYKEQNSGLRDMPDEDIIVPSDFEYRNHKTCYLLVAKVFRKSKHLVEDVGELPPGDTRAKVRQKEKADKRRLSAEKDMARMKKLKIEAAKATISNQKLEARKAQVQEVKTQLDLLKQFKGVYDDSAFKQKAKAMFDQFPDPSSLQTAISIDLSDEEDGGAFSCSLPSSGSPEESDEEVDDGHDDVTAAAES